MHRHVPLILKNTLRNRRRSVLTISSLSASVCLLVVLAAIYQMLVFGGDPAPARALRFITHHKVSLAKPLPLAYVRQIEQVQGVEGATVWQWLGGSYRDSRDSRNFFARFGVDPTMMFRVWPEYAIPEEQRLAFERQRTACVSSRSLASKFGWKPGERITLAGDSFPITLDLELVGILEDPGNGEVLFFNHAYLRESLPAESGRRDLVSQVMVRVADPENAPAVAERIDALFANSPDPTATESESAFLLNFVSFLGDFKLFLAAICSAVAFTILLVSGNTLSMSVRERVREVGILKTLGFTPSAILGIFLGEAALISTSAALIGCPAAGLVCGVIRNLAPPFIPGIRSLGVTPPIAGLSFLAVLAMGLASALIPAMSASRMSILNSLRHNG